MSAISDDNLDLPSKLGKNFLWMTWSGVISIANSVLVWVFMARMRDIDDVGRFTIVMGLYALFFNLTALGLMPYLVNEFSRCKAKGKGSSRSVKKFASSASVFLTIAGTACAVGMTASAFIVSDSYQVRMSAIVLSLTMVPSNLITILESASIAYGRVKLLAGVTTSENILRTVVPLWLIWNGSDIITICSSFAVIRILAMFIYFAAVRASIQDFSFSKRAFRTIARVSPTFAGTSMMAAINWQTPLFMLAYFSTEVQTAEFGAASRFLIPVSIILAGFANTIQPTVARKVLQDVANSGIYLSKMAAIPVSIAAVAAVASLFLSESVLGLLFGDTYRSASTTLIVLTASIIPFCLVMVGSRGLIATGSQRVDLYANLIGFAACVLAGSIAIPAYGAIGAALAQLVCFSAMALIEAAFLFYKLGPARFGSRAALSSASVMLVCGLLWNL